MPLAASIRLFMKKNDTVDHVDTCSEHLHLNILLAKFSGLMSGSLHFLHPYPVPRRLLTSVFGQLLRLVTEPGNVLQVNKTGTKSRSALYRQTASYETSYAGGLVSGYLDLQNPPDGMQGL